MEHQSTGQSVNYSGGGSGFSFQSLIARVKLILLSPKAAWDQISVEPTTVKEIYLYYAVPLAGFMALCQFLGSWLVGISVMGITYRLTLMNSLSVALSGFLTHLISIYVAAWILSFLAPKFSGIASVEKALQLVVYAATPTYLAGVFYFIPGLWIGTLVLSLYAIYLFWTGIHIMMNVPPEKKAPYTVVSVIAIFITMFIIGAIMAAIFGGVAGPYNYDSYPAGQKIELPGGVTIDPDEARRSMEQLQRMMPPQ